MNHQGLYTNAALLGEEVRDTKARAVVDEYLAILARLHAEDLRANVASKLTHLGLDIDEELAYENLRARRRAAGELGNFIRIDMEYSALVDPTLRLYRRLREAGHANVGTVLQSYLYRTPDDLESLLPLEPNLRLVKGAYLEPVSVAYPRKADVDAAYLRLVERSLTGGGYTAITTHDDHHRLVPRLRRAEGISRDRFELQCSTASAAPPVGPRGAGSKVLTATPLGPEWHPFYIAARRAAGEPALRPAEPGRGAGAARRRGATIAIQCQKHGRPGQPEQQACASGSAAAARTARRRCARTSASPPESGRRGC